MGNSGNRSLQKPLEKLASHPNDQVAQAARQALKYLCG
jgi:hypothetical protein